MTESAMADSSEKSLNHQTKKKKTDEQMSTDIGMKPVQLQRRRVWRACESCRRKKIKCDGVEPTCSQCAGSKSQCTWLQTKDRAALSRHYVQELEARLLHMETLLQHVTPLLEQVRQAGGDVSGIAAALPAGTNGQEPNIIQAILAASGKNPTEVLSRTGTPSPVKVEDDVSESFGQLALDEHGQMRWIGSSSTMSLIQSFRTLTATSPLRRVSPMEDDPRAPGPSVNKLYFPASVYFGKVRALPGPEEVEYPPRDLSDKLVDAYFSRVHFLMPVIDKPSFLKRYEHLMHHTNDPNLARSETAFLALVNAMFACAAKLVDDPRLSVGEGLDDAGMGMVYYERALILHYISHTSMQVEHVQCFLLMASFLCSVNCLPQAWIIVGQAIRIAQDIGLHRSPRRLLIPPIEKETRRKVWWGCYILDRMLALALGRPLGVEDSDCDVEIPQDVEDDNLPEYFQGANMTRQSPSLMRGFLELTSLYKIAGKVLRQVYSLDKCKEHLEPEKRAELNRSVEYLDKALTKWVDDLPIVFKSNPITDKQVSMAAVLCTHYYSILTTLHRNFLPVKPDQPVLPRSTAKAVSTARACIRLAPSIKNVVPPSHHLAFFIQTLFSSAVIILLYAMHTTDVGAAQTATEEAQSCLTVLESWEGLWPGARKCKELLDDLMGTAKQAINSVTHGQGRTAQSASPNPSPATNSSPGPSNASAAQDSRMQPPAAIPSSSERALRARASRRNRSRDVHLSPRMGPTSGYYRHDPLSQRARSTSRKRPHNEDYQDYGNPSLASVLSGTYSARAAISAHSSPGSANSHPSPPSRLETTLEASPPMLNLNTFASGPPQSPTSQSQQNSQFPYDFGVPQSPLESRWPGDTNGLQSYDISGTQGLTNFHDPSYNTVQQTSMDSTYAGYDAHGLASLSMGMSSLSTTPPSANFSGPGLPFRGLDYIRNFNAGGYPGIDGEHEGLWQTFDPSAFGIDPEIPFTLGDIPVETQEEHMEWPNDN